MTETFYIKPKPGLVVRDPITLDPLPPEGAEKPRNQYWLRRVSDGDVIETKRPKQPKE